MSDNYNYNVFINCPFDKEYKPILDAIVFTIYACNFIPRSALEENDSGNVRFEKIIEIISDSKLGIHDISRTELDKKTSLPRFNMPFELGLFLGAKKFGAFDQSKKRTLILDKKKHRYQKLISDIAGQDPKYHNEKINKVILSIRDWLNNNTKRKIPYPSGRDMYDDYKRFQKELPLSYKKYRLKEKEIQFTDYCFCISDWLEKNYKTKNSGNSILG